MKPDVPDELMDVAAKAWQSAPDDTTAEIRHILAAVLPVHEQLVLAKVAEEIAAAAPCAPEPGCNPYCQDCIRYRQAQRDIKIARGGA